MAHPPTSFELGHARKLVFRVNAGRRKLGPLAQRNELDRAAWQMLFAMQKVSSEPTRGYPNGMAPAERVKRLGFRPNQTPVERCAYKPKQRLWWSKDDLLRHVVEDWLKDTTFLSAVSNRAYVWCGAAYRDNCYVLLVAG